MTTDLKYPEAVNHKKTRLVAYRYTHMSHAVACRYSHMSQRGKQRLFFVLKAEPYIKLAFVNHKKTRLVACGSVPLQAPARNGLWNMAVDEALFESAPECAYPATLRIYRWSHPTISLGRRQKLHEVVDFDACRKCNVDIVRRFTGGSAVYHHKEITYCFTAQLSAGNHVMDEGIWRNIFLDFLERMGINPDDAPTRVEEGGSTCFSSARYDEPTVKGRKWTGSARRKNRNTFLQHGSILLKPQPLFLGELLPGAQTDISTGTGDLVPGVSEEEVEKHFVSAIENGFHLDFMREGYTPGEQAAIKKLYELKRCETQARAPASLNENHKAGSNRCCIIAQ